MFLLVFIFLKRNWNKDLQNINKTFQNLIDNKSPFWLMSHLEGTRMNPSKLKESQDFAKKKDLPILENVLLPRTKGFISTVQGLRKHSDAIYDFTIAYLNKDTGDFVHTKGPGLMSICARNPRSSVHIYVRRYPMSSVPQSEEELNAWCIQVWKEKDDLLKYFDQHKTFEKPLNYPRYTQHNPLKI